MLRIKWGLFVQRVFLAQGRFQEYSSTLNAIFEGLDTAYLLAIFGQNVFWLVIFVA